MSVRDGATDVTHVDLTERVLARVGPEGTRVTDLAEQARVTKQIVTFMID